MQNNNQDYIQNYEKFMCEIINPIIGDGDFSNVSRAGIIDLSGKIGRDVLYHGIRGTSEYDLGIVKNTNTNTRVALSKMTKPYSIKALCHFEYKTSQWNYVKNNPLEKDELKHIILVKTPKALTKKGHNHIQDCCGFINGNNEGILRIEYSQNENPEKFLVNLIQTVEQSKANASTIQPKKLHKLNFIAKLAHLINKNHTTTNTVDNQDPWQAVATGAPVELPHTETELEEPNHCNLRRAEWAYHTKLTTPDHEK